MKKQVLTALFLFTTTFCFSQYYIDLVPSLTNTAGTIADKANIAVEVGKQWDAFSLAWTLVKPLWQK